LAKRFDPAVFLAALRAAYPAFAALPDPPDPLALYLSRPEFSRLDAARGFDEAWYRETYPDVAQAVARREIASGLHHFALYGAAEGRQGAPDAEPAPAAAPAASPAAAPASAPAPLALQLMEDEFDADFYLQTYLAREESEAAWDKPFRHYLQVGRRKGYSPHARFSEAWYVAFYPDVREAIGRGELLCGFHHWVLAGRAEGREPRFDMARALEVSIPGVTEPVLLQRSRALEDRLRPMPCRVVEAAPRTLWVVLPRLNPDISFGGYRACFELVAALRPWAAARGLALSVLVLEEERANLDYFLWRIGEGRLRDAFAGLPVRTRAQIDTLEIGPRDRFLAYSSWDVIFSAPLAALTDEPRVIALVQEYEPVFHEYGSVRAISDWAFELPIYPVFNAAVLRDFFVAQAVGPFKGGARPQEGPDYAVFEHVLNRLPRQTAADMKARRGRTLALYARPEGHAARNLYELAELALKTLCAQGRFDGRWRFVGLGALKPTPPVDLGGGCVLEFTPKLSEADYRRCLGGLDIGVSLMYAPHPSVIPFEFATTGALVVTNTFSNRQPEWFAKISPNLVACEPTLPGVTAGLEAALARVEDVEARAAGALIPVVEDWPQVFDAAFLDGSVGRLV
jgi:hypothetical protein